MKKFWIQIVALFIVILVSLFLTYNNNFSLTGSNTQNQASNATQLKIGDTLLNIEIADTPDKRSIGLSNRDQLASDSGMLFIFDKPDKYKFWMKDTRIPLDFIWINGTVVADILKNIQPPPPNQSVDSLPIYEPVVPVDKVLEVNAGFVDSKNIKVGDNVTLINP